MRRRDAGPVDADEIAADEMVAHYRLHSLEDIVDPDCYICTEHALLAGVRSPAQRDIARLHRVRTRGR